MRKIAQFSFFLLSLTGLFLVFYSREYQAVAQGTGQTTRVSVASDGTQGSGVGKSSTPAISGDGRYVAFYSSLSNLVTDDTNSRSDIFVHDRQTGQTTLVSVASDGTQGDGHSFAPAISYDGRYVAFESEADNLTPDYNANGGNNVFVHDQETGQTTLVSVASDGTQRLGGSEIPAISDDGRYIAFRSTAKLVPEDTNFLADIFVHDLQTGQTTRVSVAADGTQVNSASYAPTISGDGRYVAFWIGATNLFVHDRQTGQTTLIPEDPGFINHYPSPPAISSGGRYVAFFSSATTLVPGDTNDTYDIFVYDRQMGQTTRVSVASDGTQGNGRSDFPAISSDGRYVAFESLANNLVPGDTNNKVDIFVHDRQTGQTTRVSVASDGTQGNESSSISAISNDGRYVAFTTGANNLVTGDTNSRIDVFVHDRGVVNTMYTVSGQVTDLSNQPIPGVLLDITPANITTTTDLSGNYTFTGLITGTYTLTPTKSGYVFSPTMRTVSLPPYTLTQNFKEAGVSIDGINLTQISVVSGTLDPLPVESEIATTVEGNDVFAAFDIQNTLSETVDGTLTILDVTEDPSTGFATLISVNLESGHSFIDLEISTDGMAYDSTGQRTPQRSLIAELSLTSGRVITTPITLGIRPRPVVLVHGLSDDETGWNDYAGSDGFLNSMGITYCLDKVEDCAVDTLDTGKRDDWKDHIGWVTNDIDENAQLLKVYITGIKEEAGAQQVDVVAHSLGGLITRRYIANYMSAENPDVNQLIMLGPPNEGSVSAEAIIKTLLFLPGTTTIAIVGWNYPAILELRPSYLRQWNRNNSERYGVPFYAIAGHYTYELLPFCLNPNILEPEPNDIIVWRESVFSIPLDGGWTYPSVGAGSCRSMHMRMRSKGADQGGEPIFNFYVQPLLKGLLPSPAPEVSGLAVIHQSSSQNNPPPIQYTKTQTGTLYPGGHLEFAWTAEPGTKTNFTVVGPPSQLMMSLRDSNGQVITSSTTDPQIAYMQMDDNLLPLTSYSIQNITTGTWTVILDANGQTPIEGVDMAVTMSMSSTLQLTISEATNTLYNNKPATITAQLNASGTLISGADVNAQLTFPDGLTNTVTLLDDGQHNDGAVDDGLYGYEFTPDQPGVYVASIVASGTYNNNPFDRVGVWTAPVVESVAISTTNTLSITSSGSDVILNWQPITDATSYHVYRNRHPYATLTASFAIVSNEQFTDTNAINDGLNYYYVVTAVNALNEESDPSNEVGLFNYTVLPGWNLLSLPLLPNDISLDNVLGQQLFGTEDPLTADRILVWDGVSQSYESAWFCGGILCEGWGDLFANHWLANDYSQSSLTLQPDTGFWLQNRSGMTETLAIVGNIAAETRLVAIGVDWQMLGLAFPDTRTLDAANIPASGSEDPLTADRILYWNAVTQSYDSAWFCGGVVCESWGEPWANHWLANDYSQSLVVLQPGHGFWYQNRHNAFTWTNVAP